MLSIAIQKLRPDVVVPSYAHGSSEDAGMDLRAAEDFMLAPAEIKAIPTGLAIAIPSWYMGEVRTRSGLALKGVVCNNAPGTIDPGYRGEIKVILLNQSMTTMTFMKGDRIAQLIVVPYIDVCWNETVALPESTRGEGGLGSTGVR